MYFGNINALYLLYFLIPLVILYLIKAKPKEITIPSLMFFSDDRTVKKYRSILKKLLLRALFFLQLLFIVIIALSGADPVVQIPIDAYSLNTVVIVDVSASMNTMDINVKRIDAGKQELLKFIKGRVSVILAEESPVIMASNVSAARAKALITNLGAKDIGTRLDSSVLLANDLLGSEKGNIIVYSDFVLSEEDDILAAKKIAEANDKRVILIQTGEKQANLGWVMLDINRGRGEAFVKNFGRRDETVDVRLVAENKQQKTERIEIPSFSVERVSFEVNKGVTILELSRKDRLNADDKIYIVNPYEKKSDILFITSKEANNPILNALQANARFNVKVSVPPVIPDLDYDLVVVNKVNNKMLLPNTFRDMKKYKEDGGRVIITSQENLNELDFKGLIDFRIGKLAEGEEEVCVDVVNDFTARISEPRCFTSSTKYYEADIDKNSSVSIASTAEGRPIFIMENNLFYYGLIDDFSGFKEQINYPLFWDDLIDFMLGRQSLSNFNFKTGDILIAGNRSDKVMLDKAGIFDINGRKVAVNLLNDAESDIFKDSIIMNKTEYATSYEKVNLDVNLGQYLLLLAVLIFAYELFYIKRRGDL